MRTLLTLSLCLITLIIQAQKEHALANQYFELGEQSLNAGKYKEAIDYFTRCLVINAKHEEAFRQRAQAKEGINDWIGAVTDYSSVLAYSPENAETLFNRAVARYHAKQFEFAIEDFERVLTIPKSETTAIFYAQLPFGGGTSQLFTTATIKNYVIDYIGLAELGLKRHDKALAYFDSAIHLNNQSADFYTHRGMAHEALQNYAAAKNDYTTALSLDHNHSVALNNLDHLPVKKEKIDLEEAILSQSIDRDPHLPYAYRERAFHRFNKGNYEGALIDYNKAIDIDSTDVETWLNRGLVKEKMNDLRGAYSDYTKVIDLRQDNAKAWMSRGNILGKMGSHKEALEDYTIAIFYNPEYAQAYYNRAIIKHKTGNSREACLDIKMAIQYGMRVGEKVEEAVCKGDKALERSR